MRNLAILVGIVLLASGLYYWIDYAGDVKDRQQEDIILSVTMRAENADNDARMELAERYRVGDGVPQDITRALALLRAAADTGEAAAMFRMGEIYLHGEKGLGANPPQAVIWFEVAANAGFAPAEAMLVELRKQGIARDPASDLVMPPTPAVEK